MRNGQTIVRVMKALSPDGKVLPATIYERGQTKGRQQYLTLDTRRALGSDLAAHFVAEKGADGMYWIGERLPHRLPW